MRFKFRKIRRLQYHKAIRPDNSKNDIFMKINTLFLQINSKKFIELSKCTKLRNEEVEKPGEQAKNKVRVAKYF